MPKEYFAVQNTCSLNDVPAGARIHIVGVCGVAMAQLAIELAKRNYNVSGSDKEFYEPMASLLLSSAVNLYREYSSKNISPDIKLAVIGNSISYGHAEVMAVEELKIPYTLFPKILFELSIQGKRSVVIAGTHGKTTTTALTAFLLEKLQVHPTYFIGGAAIDLPESLFVSNGPVSVVEGDEYDSAFFAKVPKFFFYAPNILVVTAVEYDHADIYPNLESIERVFDEAFSKLGQDATAIVCVDDAVVRKLLKKWKRQGNFKIITYGETPDADARLLTTLSQVDQTQQIEWSYTGKNQPPFTLQLAGRYNAKNALAALLVCHTVGVSFEKALKEIKQFRGVKRRQEIKHNKGVVLIEDFAHHPTAVRETLGGFRARYPEKRIWAVFEPRSNTSRRKVFQEDYVLAFQGADRVLLCEVAKRHNDTSNDLIDVAELAKKICESGTSAQALATPDNIGTRLLAEIKEGDILLVMSNGSFGGLVQKLRTELRRRYGE